MIPHLRNSSSYAFRFLTASSARVVPITHSSLNILQILLSDLQEEEEDISGNQSKAFLKLSYFIFITMILIIALNGTGE